MLDIINKVEDTIFAGAEYSGEKSDSFGEVFTPRNTVIQRVLRCGKERLCDKSKYWGDLFAGLGQYPIIIVKTLFKTLKSEIPDDYERLKYIVETQLYLGEIQPRSANWLAYYFQFEQGFKVNLYAGSSFDMPDDFFDLSWDERREKYPENCVLEPVEPEKVPEILVNPPSLPLSEGVSKAKLSKTSSKPKKSPKIKGERPDMTMTFVDI